MRLKEILNSQFFLFYKNLFLRKNWTSVIYPQVMSEWQIRCENILAVSGMKHDSSLYSSAGCREALSESAAQEARRVRNSSTDRSPYSFKPTSVTESTGFYAR